MARRYKSIIYATHGVQFPDSATPQLLTYRGYATPIGQTFLGYATPVGSNFAGYATPVGQIFQGYATPVYGMLPPGGTAGQVLTKADSNNYTTYWQSLTPFAGYATPVGANYSAFNYQASTPTSADAGDLWVDTETGIFYIYISDGDTSQWVQFGSSGGGTSTSSASSSGSRVWSLFVG